MKIFLCLLILTLTFFTPAYSQHFNYEKDYKIILSKTQNKKDSLYYPVLLNRFIKNDSTLSVYQMLCTMIGYTGTKDYKPFLDLETEKKIIKLNDSAKYTEVIYITDTFLQKHQLNQTALIEKAYAFHKLKQEDSSTYYKKQFGKIMAAMDWSASGRTADDAMFSIGPRDGRNFIDKYYHADLGRAGTIENSSGNLCEMIEIKYKKNKEEKTGLFYFIIQHAVNTTAKHSK